MAQQVRLRNSIVAWLLLLMTACHSPEIKINRQERKVEVRASDPAINIVNGIIYLNSRLFTGNLITLDEQSGDTIGISGYLQGKEHGEWKIYYPGGMLSQLRFFEGGKKVGLLRTWWPNGRMQMQYNFENDEYDGSCMEWNEAGLMVKQMTYEKGHEQGAQKSWYENGRTRSNYIVDKGRRYGLLGTKNCVNVSDSIFK